MLSSPTNWLLNTLTGNPAVSRTMVSELAERTGVDKGKAFSLFSFCLAVGWVSLYPMQSP